MNQKTGGLAMKTRILAACAAAALLLNAAPAHAQLAGVFFGMINTTNSDTLDAEPVAEHIRADAPPQNLEPAAGGPAFESSEIMAVQRALSARGYYRGPIDGIAGPQTDNALLAYQRVQNIDATGSMDAATLDSLGLGARLGLSAGGSVNR
jgi:peptidoglycan hydrolase-like protein with peptidoglycan-binding domain